MQFGDFGGLLVCDVRLHIADLLADRLRRRAVAVPAAASSASDFVLEIGLPRVEARLQLGEVRVEPLHDFRALAGDGLLVPAEDLRADVAGEEELG